MEMNGEWKEKINNLIGAIQLLDNTRYKFYWHFSFEIKKGMYVIESGAQSNLF